MKEQELIKKLYDELVKAEGTIRAWHNIHQSSGEWERYQWEIYRLNSPEMKSLNEAKQQAKSYLHGKNKD